MGQIYPTKIPLRDRDGNRNEVITETLFLSPYEDFCPSSFLFLFLFLYSYFLRIRTDIPYSSLPCVDQSPLSPQTGAWLGFVLCLPCLVSASCFAPESPRLLLVKEDKAGCVDSLQWLRGHQSDLAGEFTRIEDSLLLALGSRSVGRPVTRFSIGGGRLVLHHVTDHYNI